MTTRLQKSNSFYLNRRAIDLEYSLDYYKSRKRQTEREINSRRAQNQRIQNEIDELEAAYRKLGAIKRTNYNNADSVRDSSKASKITNNVQWRGKTKNQFDDFLNNQLKNAGKSFYDSIDKMQDEIGTAIANKKGQLSTGIGILDKLNKTWNWLGGVIRNWTN